MITNLYGNPHSASKPAALSGYRVDDIREKALRFLGADPEHFDLVFVANATAAIKLVMESFRDLAATADAGNGFRYYYHKDAHTSIVGVREVTDTNLCFHSDAEVEEWLEGSSKRIPKKGAWASDYDNQPSLFAYPGQSNMTGRRLPLSWTGRLRNSHILAHQNTYSLLDAAALASTSSLEHVFADPEAAPDFTSLSFYKIFGFPDLGALIVRKTSGHVLQWRKYFGGGTILMATVIDQSWHKSKEENIHETLEDGTLPFHNIVALGCAIDVHHHLYGDMNQVSRHTHFLAQRLFKGMRSMKHYNSQPLVKIYNEPDIDYSNSKLQGGTVAFNIMLPDGSYISYLDIEQQADDRDIYLRSGGLCNAGGIATYLNLKPWEFKRNWSAGHRCGGERGMEVISGKPTGVVRASLGAMSTIADVDTLLGFLKESYCQIVSPISESLPQLLAHPQRYNTPLHTIAIPKSRPSSSSRHNQPLYNSTFYMPSERLNPIKTSFSPAGSSGSTSPTPNTDDSEHANFSSTTASTSLSSSFTSKAPISQTLPRSTTPSVPTRIPPQPPTRKSSRSVLMSSNPDEPYSPQLALSQMHSSAALHETYDRQRASLPGISHSNINVIIKPSSADHGPISAGVTNATEKGFRETFGSAVVAESFAWRERADEETSFEGQIGQLERTATGFGSRSSGATNGAVAEKSAYSTRPPSSNGKGHGGYARPQSSSGQMHSAYSRPRSSSGLGHSQQAQYAQAPAVPYKDAGRESGRRRKESWMGLGIGNGVGNIGSGTGLGGGGVPERGLVQN
jgi:molybdenum cofactor sulfurtransferase